MFRFQYAHNPLYQQFADSLRCPPSRVRTIEEIPFLPISFYRSHKVLCPPDPEPEFYFESSGTSDSQRSRHYVRDLELYHQSLLRGFQTFYGNPRDYIILALLPSYLERKNASLVYMCQQLMDQSGQKENGFFLHQGEHLARILDSLRNSDKKILLIGVTFALLDFAQTHPQDLSHVIVMETGGMKGRKKEWTRSEVHDYLKDRFRLPQIHSEYGMTELLSQAYSQENGIYRTSPGMIPLIREIHDPLSVHREGSGALNFIDLANRYSCSFIATEDLGRIEGDRFEVLGRMDHSALRGCSLLTA